MISSSTGGDYATYFKSAILATASLKKANLLSCRFSQSCIIAVLICEGFTLEAMLLIAMREESLVRSSMKSSKA